MKHHIISTLLLPAALFMSSCNKSPDPAAAQSDVMPEEAQEIAKEAYLYGFPMVMNYKTMWNYAGEEDRGDVNQMLIQYFVNYNFPEFYVSSAPINTANWEADSGQQWTIPLGLGVGKVFMLGKLPMNSQMQAYYNVEHPDAGPDWSMRIQFQCMFPK